MSLTIELPIESVNALNIIAQGHGKTLEQYAREILESAILTEQRLKELRGDLQVGLDALKTGKYTECFSAEELINDLRREGQSRLS